MPTIASISADGQERLDTVRQEKVAETIKRLQNKGMLNIKVIKSHTDIKMIWSNLRENKCPKCSSILETEGMLATEHTCNNSSCDFRIGDIRFNEIVNDMYKPRTKKQFNPDENLEALNNL